MNKRSRRTRDMILAVLFTLAITVCPCFLFNVCIEDFNPKQNERSIWHKIFIDSWQKPLNQK